MRKFTELGLLLLQMLGLGFFVVPKHTPTFWFEPEFTAWVVPLSNRLAQGTKLYADGAHLPLPPLSHILAYFLTRGEGLWWHESFLNYGFQCVTLVLLFFLIHTLYNGTVAYLACSIGLAYFIALPKTILYDSTAQAMAALCLLLLVRVCHREERLSEVALLGGAIGVLLLVKQSTGVGALGGSMLFFLGRRRWKAGAALTVSCLSIVVALLFLLSPWLSPGGFVQDVLLRGSNPKGGLLTTANRVSVFGLEFLAYAAIVLVFGLALRPRMDEAKAGERVSPSGPFRLALLLWPLGLALLLVQLFSRWHYPHPSVTLTLMWPALVMYFFYTGRYGSVAERGVAVLAYTSALGHSLSVNYFRFTYDNNPLLVLVLAFLISGILATPESYIEYRWFGVPVWPTTGVVILTILAWMHGAQHIYAMARADLKVSDIPYLTGALLPKRADQGLLQMVRDVREKTGPSDRVLVLPEDPSFAAWFDRPRPNVTSSILFVDTYWERFVDEDLRRLREDPPEVIIVGPHAQWPNFARITKLRRGGNHEGIGRLISSLQSLLLFQYEEAETYRVRTLKGDDEFSVFYRRYLNPKPGPTIHH